MIQFSFLIYFRHLAGDVMEENIVENSSYACFFQFCFQHYARNSLRSLVRYVHDFHLEILHQVCQKMEDGALSSYPVEDRHILLFFPNNIFCALIHLIRCLSSMRRFLISIALAKQALVNKRTFSMSHYATEKRKLTIFKFGETVLNLVYYILQLASKPNGQGN